jgi:uncharacterized membrane protein YidH (DUF202 family)
MRVATIAVGIVLLGAGIVWFLQGIRIIPGSFMTGSRFWAVTGLVLIVIGAPILAAGLRSPRPRRP